MASHVPADRLRDLQSVTDASLAYLKLEDLLEELLNRVVAILDVDTAAILLLEDDGRTLVARAGKGLEEEVTRGVRIPVGRGFAGRIAAERRPVQILDLDHAEILNPILREKGLQSLLGVPLLVEGTVLGVLHVGSLRPRGFADDEVELLQRAADRAALAIHARLAERQRGLADALQRSLIPNVSELPGVTLAGRYLPAAAARLGGDWYDAFPLADGRVGVAIGDVVGRGFHAAALMAQLRSGLRAYALQGMRPGEALERLGQLLRQLEPGRSATLLYLLLDPHSGQATVAAAGHPPPLVVSPSGECEFLELPASVPLGSLRRASYEDSEVSLDAGSTLVLYTDGLVERPDEPLDRGLERLKRLVADTRGDPNTLCDAMIDALLPAGPGGDDVALLVARLVPFSDPLELQMPADVESIPVIRRVLGRWLMQVGAAPAEIDEITLACSEACANAVEHAYRPGPAAVEVRATVTAEREAAVLVRDFGQWRSPRGQFRGRGTLLMEGLMDGVEVTPAESGTTVRLSRRLSDVEA
jgi:anti-sigma regulatory factor (Ser/Thr protein kinase)/putative methionine-R-sulfoxide reductase with GAF domain